MGWCEVGGGAEADGITTSARECSGRLMGPGCGTMGDTGAGAERGMGGTGW